MEAGGAKRNIKETNIMFEGVVNDTKYTKMYNNCKHFRWSKLWLGGVAVLDQ